MSDPLIIETQAHSDEPIVFRINDEEYKWTPVHTGALLVAMRQLTKGDGLLPAEAVAVSALVNDVLFAGLDEDAQKRLDNQLRFLDIGDITGLMEALIEQVTARPTQSPSD